MIERRELYRSANGDAWFLGREPADGRAFIVHQPNAPSGERLTHIELGDFLRRESKGPEQQALLRLIGTLVNVPPYAWKKDCTPARRRAGHDRQTATLVFPAAHRFSTVSEAGDDENRSGRGPCVLLERALGEDVP
jgi:hypothetical protein